MKTRFLVMLSVLAIVAAACGGADGVADTIGSDNGAGPSGGQAGSDDGAAQGDSSSGEPAPEAPGTLDDNSIRIGDEVWHRTLPMTTGQCYLYEDDGTLPTSANVWGTLDGDDDVRFSARYKQDGSFEAEVSNDQDMYWGSGPRFGEDDLTMELDFENLIVTGSGTFKSLITGERALGSFQFTCEPEG